MCKGRRQVRRVINWPLWFSAACHETAFCDRALKVVQQLEMGARLSWHLEADGWCVHWLACFYFGQIVAPSPGETIHSWCD